MIETAGILLYRLRSPLAEVLLVHFGGPYWAGKDKNAWSIPKGIINRDEDPLAAAKREFAEETGSPVQGEPMFVGRYHQNGKKNLLVWMVEGDFNPRTLRSNTFKMVCPQILASLKPFLKSIRRNGSAKTELCKR